MLTREVDATRVEGIEQLVTSLGDDCYRAFGERFPYALVLLDATLEIQWASPGFAAMLGYADTDGIGLQVLDIVHPDDLATIMPMAIAVLERAEEILDAPSAAGAVELPVRVRSGDGRWLPMMIIGRVFDEAGRLLALMRPAADRYALDIVLERLGHRAELDEVLPALADLVCAQFTLGQAWLIHDTHGVAAVVGSDQRPPIDGIDEVLRTLRAAGPSVTADTDDERWIVPILSSTGDTLYGAFVMPSPRLNGPNPYDLHVLARTVGLASLAFTRAEDDRLLQRAATTDHLTGALNRRAFELRLAQTALRDDHYPVAAFFVDLDGFKSINDTYGHHIGDEVLTVVAKRLQRAIRAGDSLGRLGGDEFAVLCPDLESADVGRMAERLDHAFAEPVEVSGHRLGVTSAIGVASTRDEGGLEHLLRMADADMYRHKHRTEDRARA